MSVRRNTTQYGLEYGPLEVSRICEIRGHVILRVETPYVEFEIQATPKGQKVRITRLKGEKRIEIR
jgi:hypothetical protein